jgi:hypothetical protein
MAIVLPITMRGVSYATSAAASARRRNEAAALAQSKLDELLATQAWSTGSTAGDFVADGWPDYSWSAELVQWSPNGMQLSNGLGSESTNSSSSVTTGTSTSVSSAGTNTGMSSTASSSNNTLQELDLHVTWKDNRGQQTLTLSTLVYQSGNSVSATSGLPQ